MFFPGRNMPVLLQAQSSAPPLNLENRCNYVACTIVPSGVTCQDSVEHYLSNLATWNQTTRTAGCWSPFGTGTAPHATTLWDPCLSGSRRSSKTHRRVNGHLIFHFQAIFISSKLSKKICCGAFRSCCEQKMQFQIFFLVNLAAMIFPNQSGSLPSCKNTQTKYMSVS